MEGLPSPGDVVLVARAASVQFGTPIRFRVIRVISEWVTYDRWVWLRGYQLDDGGDAAAKRDVFVQPAGLHLLRRAASAPPPRWQPNQRPAHPGRPTALTRAPGRSADAAVPQIHHP